MKLLMSRRNWRLKKQMTRSDEYLLNELRSINDRLSVVVSELKKKNGIIDTQLLDALDKTNKLTVEV